MYTNHHLTRNPKKHKKKLILIPKMFHFIQLQTSAVWTNHERIEQNRKNESERRDIYLASTANSKQQHTAAVDNSSNSELYSKTFERRNPLKPSAGTAATSAAVSYMELVFSEPSWD